MHQQLFDNLLSHQPRQRMAANRVVVLVSGSNPSFDYYIAPRIETICHRVIDIDDDFFPESFLEAGDYVLICRYLRLRWALAIAKSPFLAGVGYFFDDDLSAFAFDNSIPLSYRSHVALRTVVPFQIIRRVVTEVFVSTPVLKHRYAKAHADILHPIPDTLDLKRAEPDPDRPLRIAMHAQLSHLAEHAFAAEVMEIVARRIGGFEMDVIGPIEASGLWQNVPNVLFRPEIPWREYRRETAHRPADILIAPLLETRVNRARAPTKAIDAVRMGAAAVFSELDPYAELHGAAVLVRTDRAAWSDAITALATDPERRRENAEKLRARVSGWRDLIRPLVRTS